MADARIGMETVSRRCAATVPTGVTSAVTSATLHRDHVLLADQPVPALTVSGELIPTLIGTTAAAAA
jgi:hypothetical protein